MPKSEKQRRAAIVEAVTARALAIDLDTHQHLLAVLVSAVDHLPGGRRALEQALAQRSDHDGFVAETDAAPLLSAEMCREFIAAYAHTRDGAAPDRIPGPAPTTSGERRTLYVD